MPVGPWCARRAAACGDELAQAWPFDETAQAQNAAAMCQASTSTRQSQKLWGTNPSWAWVRSKSVMFARISGPPTME